MERMLHPARSRWARNPRSEEGTAPMLHPRPLEGAAGGIAQHTCTERKHRRRRPASLRQSRQEPRRIRVFLIESKPRHRPPAATDPVAQQRRLTCTCGAVQVCRTRLEQRRGRACGPDRCSHRVVRSAGGAALAQDGQVGHGAWFSKGVCPRRHPSRRQGPLPRGSRDTLGSEMHHTDVDYSTDSWHGQGSRAKKFDSAPKMCYSGSARASFQANRR